MIIAEEILIRYDENIIKEFNTSEVWRNICGKRIFDSFIITSRNSVTWIQENLIGMERGLKCKCSVLHYVNTCILSYRYLFTLYWHFSNKLRNTFILYTFYCIMFWLQGMSRGIRRATFKRRVHLLRLTKRSKYLYVHKKIIK